MSFILFGVIFLIFLGLTIFFRWKDAWQESIWYIFEIISLSATIVWGLFSFEVIDHFDYSNRAIVAAIKTMDSTAWIQGGIFGLFIIGVFAILIFICAVDAF